MIHYLHKAARDPDFEGCAALCDHRADLTEAPRNATMSSILMQEVNCPACLFLALFEDAAACEAPEGTQLDDVLQDFQAAYDRATNQRREKR